MKPKLAFSVGTLAVLALIGVTVAEMQLDGETQPAQAAADPAAQPGDTIDSAQPTAAAESVLTEAKQAEENAEPDAPVGPIVRPGPRDEDVRHARGLYMRPDGTLVGRVNYIDRNTLLLVPVPNALISFVQERKVIGQAVTDTHGMFAVKGLTPWAVYSVIAASKDYVCMFATVARPYDHDNDHWHRSQKAAEPGENVGLHPGWVNEIRFVAFVQEDDAAASDAEAPADGDAPAAADAEEEDESEESEDGDEPAPPEDDDGATVDYLDYEFHEFQMIPREDFIMALREGLFGFDVGMPPSPFPAGGAGGVAGGGVGDVVGPAVIGTAIGLGIGAGIGASETDNDRASPFRP